MDIDKKAVENANKVKSIIFGRSKKKSPKRKKNKFLLVVISLVILVFLAYNYSDKVFVKDVESEELTATVNGEVISQQEVDEFYAQLPPDLQAFVTKQDLLEQLIDRKILLQESVNVGVEATEDEVIEIINELKSQFPEEQIFDELLAQQGVSMEQLKDQAKEQIILSKLLEEELETPEITDQEIEDFFNENKVENMSLEDVSEQIREILTNQKQQQEYANYVGELRTNSIISYSGELSFVGCLKNKDVKLYGADWCEHTQKQTEILGESLEELYVPCEDSDKNPTELCPDLEAYPTWEINNIKYIGILSKKRLTKLTGCE